MCIDELLFIRIAWVGAFLLFSFYHWGRQNGKGKGRGHD